MQFDVRLRDGPTYMIEALYLEVSHGPVNSTYTLLGAVPGFPVAILAVFPTDLVEAVVPAGSSGTRSVTTAIPAKAPAK